MAPFPDRHPNGQPPAHRQPNAQVQALAIARRQTSSSAIINALNPLRGIRDEIARRGGVPKNHARENVLKMREIERVVQTKKTEAEHERMMRAKAPPVPTQYEHVPSRLYNSKSQCASETSLPYLHGSATSSLAKELPARRTKVGEVPAYIKSRQEQRQRETQNQRQRKLEQESWPPGTRLLSEDERKDKLNSLLSSQSALQKELSAFPITLNTSSIQRYKRKQQVEEMLNELEHGITLFSRARVFVPCAEHGAPAGTQANSSKKTKSAPKWRI